MKERKINNTASNFISLILIIMLYWSISTFFTNLLKLFFKDKKNDYIFIILLCIATFSLTGTLLYGIGLIEDRDENRGRLDR